MTKLLTTKQAAKYMGVDESTIRKWILSGKLKADSPGERIRLIRKSALDKIIVGIGGRGKRKKGMNIGENT